MVSSASFTDGTAVDPGPLLKPRSVAVVGANDRPGSYADTVLRNLERAGFEGSVWGVHPTRTEVHGRECVPSLLELPEPVDAVVIAIPAAAVAGAVSEAIERGCGGAIVFAAGFAEVESGRELEAELRRLAIGGRFPVCGPNGNGVVAVGARAPLWGDSVPELEPGRVAMISQSGNVAVNAIGSRRGIDFHTLISTGNQAVARCQRLARRAGACGRRRLGGDVPGSRRRRGPARRGARPVRRARHRGRGAQGRFLGCRRAGRGSRTRAPWPVTSGSSAP